MIQDDLAVEFLNTRPLFRWIFSWLILIWPTGHPRKNTWSNAFEGFYQGVAHRPSWLLKYKNWRGP